MGKKPQTQISSNLISHMFLLKNRMLKHIRLVGLNIGSIRMNHFLCGGSEKTAKIKSSTGCFTSHGSYLSRLKVVRP